ncbi:hypothetical protein [Parashewanella tropica]|uniref:hypothetical protein n=1 Tax=Parashewanella tropica TaxID=2547970 RepID=UPI00105AA534|nr:hypothetical protein [Parashewanella tropica]
MKLVVIGLLCLSTSAVAVEQKWSGIIDVSVANTDSTQSYLEGGLGKFRANNGTQLALSQVGLSHHLQLNDHWSTKVVANGYWDNVDNGIGITEAIVKYRGLPSENGYRVEAQAGIMYPNITLENLATAWASPYTLNYSAINAWLAEEVRHAGMRIGITRLGKFHQSPHSFSLNIEAFANNDTTGALLAWHGWTQSSRQTLWHETIPVPKLPQFKGALSGQAKQSDPFLELDNRLGTHISAQWSWRGKGRLLAGYYDNNANTKIVKNGQYAWRTRFHHLGVKWRLPARIEMIAQYMKGDTLMMDPKGFDAVNNDYQSANLLLSRRWNQHTLSGRIEHFSVTDNDKVAVDNNNESGRSLTLSYRYRIQRGWFIHTEFNWIDSERQARTSIGLPKHLIERQWQLATRYFF